MPAQVHVDQAQHTMHALEMLLPHEQQVKRSGQQATQAGSHSAVPAAASAKFPSAASHLDLLEPPVRLPFPSNLPRGATVISETSSQQQLPSPASRVATVPFSGPPPALVTEQQQQESQLPRQHVQSLDTTAKPAGHLELSLSAEQIALLQAAADNAQNYLERDATTSETGLPEGTGASFFLKVIYSNCLPV